MQIGRQKMKSFGFAWLAAVSIKLQTAGLLIKFGQSLFGFFIHILQCPVFPYKRMAAKKLIDVIQCDGRSIHEFEIMAIIYYIVRIVRKKG